MIKLYDLLLFESIRVDTSSYEASHSKKPSGYGNWAFEINGETVFLKGTYSSTKQQAIKKAKELKATSIKVLSEAYRPEKAISFGVLYSMSAGSDAIAYILPVSTLKNGNLSVLEVLVWDDDSPRKRYRAKKKSIYSRDISKLTRATDVPPNVKSAFGSSLNERKSGFEIHHRTFSSACRSAYEYAKSKGYEISDDEIFQQVTTGPKRPAEGVTNSYKLELTKNGKPTKHMLVFQVYGMKTQFELNCYIS